jgi:peroxiredoxin
MLPLKTAAPDFSLPDAISAKTLSMRELARPEGLLVMFICRHCPFVKHLEYGLAQLGHDYSKQPIGIAAISSNDVSVYPEDAPASLKQQAKSAGFAFPYLYDESQSVAKAFGATCTPDFFLFDRSLQLAYRGQFDSSRPGNGVAVTGNDLRTALDALLAGQEAPSQQRPSIGCSIKWK